MPQEPNQEPNEESLSLSRLESDVAEQLGRLGLEAGEAYLSRVKRLVDPLQEQIDAGREALWGLKAQAAVADDAQELRRVNEAAVEMAAKLFLSLRSVSMVQEFCGSVRESIAERALELSRRKLYFSGNFSDLPLALFSVGSDGRREQALYSDQDFLFLYGTSEDGAGSEAIDDFFGMLGGVFMVKLEEAGIERCSGGIMPVNDDWRGSWPQWRERLENTFRFERSDWQKNVLNLIALMDARFICGDQKLGRGFGEFVRTLARDDSRAMHEMARVVSAMRLPKGFLRWFTVEAEGPHKGEFNLKVMAFTPLVMCVRLLAVYYGVEETSTLGRIARLKSGGCFSERLAAELSDAYHVIARLRILLQIRRRKRIIDDDSYLNPYELAAPEREALRKAIGSIEELQNSIRNRFWITREADLKVAGLR